MQVSVWYLGGMDGTVEMKGLRKEKGAPEGTKWHGETDARKPERGWEKERLPVAQVDL